MRLGEHDILTMDDGIHENVPIIHVEKHPAYTTKGGAKNDIAIVYLEYNVQITGKTMFHSNQFACPMIVVLC